MSTHNIVQKLWSLCDILRDDGITYHQYVTELTLLLFLKMAEETQTEHRLPAAWRWDGLKTRNGVDQLNHYRKLLLAVRAATAWATGTRACWRKMPTRPRAAPAGTSPHAR